MSQATLNKSALSRLERQRDLYKRFLPSLEMKRRTLLAERQQTAAQLAAQRAEIDALETEVGEALPMLADDDVVLEAPLRIATLRLGDENRVGVRLPVLAELAIERAAYPRLVQPHWMDGVLERLEQRLRLEVAQRIATRRLAILDAAARTVTQRVNLFEKVMIPQAEAAIARIELYLADQERASVVRAKLAKRKRQAAERREEDA
ncbi:MULTISPECIES: V-type ATP synthase subunit D [unclassified Modicisalibacter]|uniref:V-type ATP synthase subunit D n=1 Tax=unclassified Modicisalibacter TaxID=2679913 RepID=UPI001CCD4E41|nr:MULTISPECIES: V-type ATP synthase subunit D [unclassified Modicisalibacter]MBZ9558401.1 V-type ATP synthase subunit D [Modicisalibacter sp. R2A 31.J]MBZ9575707.1 V-type ATP synthase subunit D [Modicisalibacter sp. MOD 31.J]